MSSFFLPKIIIVLRCASQDSRINEFFLTQSNLIYLDVAHLLSFGNLYERKQFLSTIDEQSFNDPLCAYMSEYNNESLSETKKRLDGYADEKLPITIAYSVLQALSGNKTLVETINFEDILPDTLTHALAIFAEPIFLHIYESPIITMEYHYSQKAKTHGDSTYELQLQVEQNWVNTMLTIFHTVNVLNSSQYIALDISKPSFQCDKAIKKLCAVLETPLQPDRWRNIKNHWEKLNIEKKMRDDFKFKFPFSELTKHTAELLGYRINKKTVEK